MAEPMPLPAPPQPGVLTRWAKVIDHERCIGCHACSTACKSENAVPLGVNRTYVKSVDVGEFPQARRAFQVTRCNQCDDAPCTVACPTTAMYRRPDGIVDFDKSICIGCKACIAACPYDAIFINPEDHAAEKCNFCAHRIDVGLEPACVVVCPTEAIIVGDLDDPSSKVAQIVHRDVVAVRRPEKETHPKLFYRGAHQATLDPLAARRPEGGLFMWSEQWKGERSVVSGHPQGNSSAAALLSYDVPHQAPWDWKVSLYTLTKGVASGVYLVAALLLALGAIDPAGPIWRWAVPILGGFFLAATGILLIADLEQPKRFLFIFTRPQWRSWLVRGAFLIAGYSAVLALHFAATVFEWSPRVTIGLAWLGTPAALLAAVYTAYLFAQAKARDLWQNPLLPPHLAVQAVFAGAAALLPVAHFWEPGAIPWLLLTALVSGALHLLLVLGECTITHPTAHARLAQWEMTSGRFRGFFRWGLGLVAASALLVAGAGFGWIGGSAALATAVGISALAGLLCHEHAWVQAGQAVPLA